MLIIYLTITGSSFWVDLSKEKRQRSYTSNVLGKLLTFYRVLPIINKIDVPPSKSKTLIVNKFKYK